MIANFQLGGVVCPLRSILNYRQTIEPIDGGRAILRSVNGTGILRTAYEKMRISWGGEGRLPLALAGLDYSQVLVLKCGGPRVFYSATPTGIPIPGTFRTGDGFDPRAYAFKDEAPIRTNVTIGGGEADCDSVADADFYQVRIWPIYNVIVVQRPEDFDDMAARFPFSFVAEEV